MTKIEKHNRPYESRQIVAKIGRVGNFRMNGKAFTIPEYLTFYAGSSPSFAAKFDRIADVDGDRILRLETLAEGEILVDPGLVYKKTEMTGMVMQAHLQAMRVWKPKQIMDYEYDGGPAIDMGEINLSNETIN